MKLKTKEDVLAYIAARVEVNADTGCHEWQGPKTKDGYGQFGSDHAKWISGSKLVHRAVVALTTDFKFTSRDQQVMHGCHNRACCNPGHLSVGTAKENIRQAWERGSYANWLANQTGEKNHNAKLKEADVRVIRQRVAAGATQASLAREFGVSPRTISVTVARQSWQHVD